MMFVNFERLFVKKSRRGSETMPFGELITSSLISVKKASKDQHVYF